MLRDVEGLPWDSLGFLRVLRTFLMLYKIS